MDGPRPRRSRAIDRALVQAPRRLGPAHLLGLLGATTAAYVLWDLARGGGLSLLGLTLGPPYVASALWLLGRGAQEARAGARARGALLLVALVALTALMASGAVTRGVIFPGAPTPLPPTGPLALEGVRGEVVAYRADDGVALRGAHVRPPGERAGAAVYFHGNAEAAAHNVDLARALAERGVAVLVAEYRGYGGCEGSPSEAGLLADGRAAVRALCEREGVQPGEVVLVGRSLGTGVAAALAAEGLGRGVVLVSPYTAVVDLAAEQAPLPLALLAVRDTFRSRERLLRATQPVVILHGTRDGVIPFAHGEALAAALGARARLLRIEGAGHGDVLVRARQALVDETLRLAGLIPREAR